MLLYVNPSRDRLRISHLTFWGSRRESYFDLSEFLPVSLSKQSWSDPYIRLHLPERGYCMYFAPKYGGVADSQTLFKLLD